MLSGQSSRRSGERSETTETDGQDAVGLPHPVAAWFASRWQFLNRPDRVHGVDLAFGLAVFGMLAELLLSEGDPFDIANPSTWMAVVDGRATILFATLAGVIVGLMTGGATPFERDRRDRSRLRLAVQGAALGVLGIVLLALWLPFPVILPAFAILFLLVLPFTGFAARTLFVIAGAVALVMPFAQVWLDLWATQLTTQDETNTFLLFGWKYPFPLWSAFAIAGLGLARAGIRRTRVLAMTLVAGVGLAVVGYGLDARSGAGGESESWSLWYEVWTAWPHSSGLLEVVGSGGFALAVIAACVLVCRTAVRWIVLPVRAVGAMAVSAYAALLVVLAVVAQFVFRSQGEVEWFRALDLFWPLTLSTLAVCTAWALVIGRGPVEWGFDALAQRVVPPARWER